MKHLFLTVLILFVIITCSKSDDFQIEEKENPVEEQKEIVWKLVWEDNFDTDGLPNGNNWDYEVGYIRNEEKQYYTKERSENARVEDGNLIIEARNDDWNDNEITSASLHTYGKKSILYGRVEVRAKLPTGLGTWPAIWMLGNSIRNGTNWPDCGEIDIMENVGYDPNTIHVNVHTKAYNHMIQTNKGDKVTNVKPYDDFHVYAIEWFEDRIDFYLDDNKIFVFKNEYSGYEKWPFDKPHYLILNFAVGGAWGGVNGVNYSIFPQKYFIDYVRVYEVSE